MDSPPLTVARREEPCFPASFDTRLVEVLNEKVAQWEDAEIEKDGPNAVYRLTPRADSTGIDALLD